MTLVPAQESLATRWLPAEATCDAAVGGCLRKSLTSAYPAGRVIQSALHASLEGWSRDGVNG